MRRTAPAANGASSGSACAGTSSTPSRRRRSRPASRTREDFNRGDNEGVGYFQVNQKAGWRWNTAKAFLRPICYGRPNFEMWTSAQVMRLVIEQQPDGSKRCTGAHVWTGDEMVTVSAAREVILSAGSIGSPQILQLSGIGPAALAGATRHSPPARAARRGREPAGPPADPRGLQGQRGDDAEHAGQQLVGQAEDRPGVRPQAQRPDEHGAVASSARSRAVRPTSPIRTSSTTSSRSAWTPSASRCTPSMPSRPASATSIPPAAGACGSAATGSRTRRRSRPTT